MKLSTPLPKNWACAWRGHRWIKSHMRGGYLKCARCGVRAAADSAQLTAPTGRGSGVEDGAPSAHASRKRPLTQKDLLKVVGVVAWLFIMAMIALSGRWPG